MGWKSNKDGFLLEHQGAVIGIWANRLQTHTNKHCQNSISLRNVLSSGFPWLALWGKLLSFLRQEPLSSPGIFIALRGVSTIAFLTLLHNYHWHYYFLRHLSFPLKCKIFEGRKKGAFAFLYKLQQCPPSRVSINTHKWFLYFPTIALSFFSNKSRFSSSEKTVLMIFNFTF